MHPVKSTGQDTFRNADANVAKLSGRRRQRLRPTIGAGYENSEPFELTAVVM